MVAIRRVDPGAVRQPVLDFFWRIKDWPFVSQDEYARYWDWRLASLSESAPTIWIATEGETVVGLVALYFRRLCLNGRQLTAGVAGNFRVDPAYQTSRVAAALVSAPRNVVRSGEIDLLLGYGNEIAHKMFLALGCRDLGAMQTLVDVRQWGPILRRRFAPLAPFAGIAARTLKLVRRARPPQPAVTLVARTLSTQEIVVADRSHWRRGDGLVADGSLAHFARRFGRGEFRSHFVLGIVDVTTGRLEGLVAAEGVNRLHILQCDLNDAVVSPSEAVELVLRALPTAESVRIPLQPRSRLAAEFAAAGFFRLPPSRSDAVLGTRRWSAYWQPTHPQAAALADVDHWQLWYGWSHH